MQWESLASIINKQIDWPFIWICMLIHNERVILFMEIHFRIILIKSRLNYLRVYYLWIALNLITLIVRLANIKCLRKTKMNSWLNRDVEGLFLIQTLVQFTHTLWSVDIQEVFTSIRLYRLTALIENMSNYTTI